MIKSIEEKIKYIRLEKSEVTLAYIDEYKNIEAPVLLAIHGLGNSFVVWMKNFQTLRQDYRCIAIDLPGNGLSEKNNSEYNIPIFSETIVEFIEELGLENVTLLGHSMGGQIALYTSIHHAEFIQSLVLIAPAGLEEFTMIEKQLMTSSNLMLDYMMTGYDKLSQALNMSFYVNNEDAKVVKNTLLDMLHLQDPMHYKKMLDQCVYSMLYDTVLQDLAKISHKVLIIFGKQDAMIPNKVFHPITTEYFAKNAAQKIPNSELILLPQAGHFVQFEALDEVNASIHNFLKTSVCTASSGSM